MGPAWEHIGKQREATGEQMSAVRSHADGETVGINMALGTKNPDSGFQHRTARSGRHAVGTSSRKTLRQDRERATSACARYKEETTLGS